MRTTAVVFGGLLAVAQAYNLAQWSKMEDAGKSLLTIDVCSPDFDCTADAGGCLALPTIPLEGEMVHVSCSSYSRPANGFVLKLETDEDNVYSFEAGNYTQGIQLAVEIGGTQGSYFEEVHTGAGVSLRGRSDLKRSEQTFSQFATWNVGSGGYTDNTLSVYVTNSLICSGTGINLWNLVAYGSASLSGCPTNIVNNFTHSGTMALANTNIQANYYRMQAPSSTTCSTGASSCTLQGTTSMEFYAGYQQKKRTNPAILLTGVNTPFPGASTTWVNPIINPNMRKRKMVASQGGSSSAQAAPVASSQVVTSSSPCIITVNGGSTFTGNQNVNWYGTNSQVQQAVQFAIACDSPSSAKYPTPDNTWTATCPAVSSATASLQCTSRRRDGQYVMRHNPMLYGCNPSTGACIQAFAM